MRTVTIALILMISSCYVHAQYFSGIIEYKVEIVPKSQSVNLDSIFETKKGEISKYYITSNYYKAEYYKDGKKTYSYTFDDLSKRMYDEYIDLPYITYRDSRKANYQYYGSKIHADSTISILGRSCYMVSYDSEYGKSKNYYSEDIKVDYKNFENHKVGNWYEKLKQVNGAIMMKSITEYEDYFETREAVKITPVKLSKKDFDVDSDKILIASYSALDKRVALKPLSPTTIACYQAKLKEAKKYKTGSETIQCYLSFIVNKTGEISYIQPYDKSLGELNDHAIKIFKNCGISFEAGEIDGRKVSSLAYFPIEF
ncbi:hypothetical protein Q2T40_09350 [Winogradskyella maritima]|uniref:TonB-like protein n=1 Tax=Winogradskyella maritima TaxID=1517766 RepID=A0ABV8ACC4_9FLAO|nr:hypothetical protein [Winogradskyella maritima]